MRTSTAKDMEAQRALFEDDIQRLERELQCSRRAKVMHTIGMRAMAERLKAGDAARQEAARESEARDASRREAIHGLEVSHRTG